MNKKSKIRNWRKEFLDLLPAYEGLVHYQGNFTKSSTIEREDLIRFIERELEIARLEGERFALKHWVRLEESANVLLKEVEQELKKLKED